MWAEYTLLAVVLVVVVATAYNVWCCKQPRYPERITPTVVMSVGIVIVSCIAIIIRGLT